MSNQRSYIKSVICICILLMANCTVHAKEYNILNFGAKKDTAFTSTEAFNSAIAECTKSGGGRVVVPAGNYKSGTIILKDNVELYLEPGATIFASYKHKD
ncbi:MAG: polygalacturonase, partial [Firmicutes bacterium]|nr:polygalacturonase [Bacillota bacterium]